MKEVITTVNSSTLINFFGFYVALKLVQIRAEAMQLASEAYKGGMATVFYAPDSQLNYACKKAKQWALDKGDEQPECCIANYLYPHCKVVAGSEQVEFVTLCVGNVYLTYPFFRHSYF